MSDLPNWYDSWKLDYPSEWDESSEEEMDDEKDEPRYGLCCPICEAGFAECTCDSDDEDEQ